MSAQNTAGHKWQLAVAVVASSPTWIIAGYRKSLSLSENAKKLDTSTVNDAGYDNCVPGQKGWSISLNHLWVVSDSALKLLRTAYKAGSSIMARVLDNSGLATTADMPMSTPVTTIAVTALNQLIPSGTKCRLGTNAVHQDIVLTADAAIGATALVFTSVTPAADIPIGSLLAIGDTQTTPDAAAGNYGTVCVTKFEKKIDDGDVRVDLTLEGQGALTDIG